MTHLEQKKHEIAIRLSKNKPVESERSKEIREMNNRSSNENLKEKIRDRHARRHLGKKGTSMAERMNFINEASKG